MFKARHTFAFSFVTVEGQDAPPCLYRVDLHLTAPHLWEGQHVVPLDVVKSFTSDIVNRWHEKLILPESMRDDDAALAKATGRCRVYLDCHPSAGNIAKILYHELFVHIDDRWNAVNRWDRPPVTVEKVGASNRRAVDPVYVEYSPS